ncbi:MAG TPA: PadR family transcriptional regulator [Ktedonobacteraceae bacterium]
MSHDDQPAPETLLPLTPAVFHILLALADGEKHGYAIMQEVGARTTGGAMRMGPGTLYGSIQRMLKDGLIVEARERTDPVHGEERRRYYRLTGFGQRVLQAEALRLEQLVHLAHSKQVLPGLGTMGGA